MLRKKEGDWMDMGNASPPFTARTITTPLELADLILPAAVREQIEDIATWAAHKARIPGEPDHGRHSRPGYRALFQGPVGTGKTMAAAVLGKHLGVPVHGIDLSSIVSRFIGETEKNLDAIFDAAEQAGAILFSTRPTPCSEGAAT